MTAPATAKIGASGNYELLVTVSCHDTDGTIASGSFEIAGFATNPLATPALASFKDVVISLQLDGRAAKGPHDYTLVIVDNEGGKAQKTATVTLE